MSPILSYHNDERPPPFKQTASAPYQYDNGASSSHDRFPPSYADESLPSSPPSAKQHHKPRNREPNDSRDDRYGGLEAEGGEDEAELLYELDVLEGGVPRGRRDSSGGIMRRPAESTEERRARGEAVISGGSGGRRGWLGAELPNRAAWKEIREMVYEVRRHPPHMLARSSQASHGLPSYEIAPTDNANPPLQRTRQSRSYQY
jgi:hypothetical protein